ncbi:DNA-J related domain-containing protein [Marinobacter sp. X15-166B]|uniref:DNA-J related domain-containing protein n=1 Tax=Marinobacter sp. X15-166B TaxID=1897620 RepID=UPI00085BEA53|nr:DNA-J related domain-containing protein [Marinobacter sp. X15-166B]OEY67179.1 molecular chaperone DnaJ [Marinobacter sp. X15-166B]
MQTHHSPASPAEQLEDRIGHLMIALERLLRQNPEGLSEHAVIKQLQAPPWELLGAVNFHEPAQLYPVHFLIYHAVYRLRDALSKQGESLSTSPLCLKITLDPVVSGTGVPAPEDELRKYYLDLRNYRLPDGEIEALLRDFWAGTSGEAPDNDALHAAARQLGFASLPETFEPIKQQFRREIMAVHPDRGGDTEAVQQLNAAFQVLKNHFRRRG